MHVPDAVKLAIHDSRRLALDAQLHSLRVALLTQQLLQPRVRLAHRANAAQVRKHRAQQQLAPVACQQSQRVGRRSRAECVQQTEM